MDKFISFIIIINSLFLIIYYKKSKNFLNIACIIQIFIFTNLFFYYRKWSLFISETQDISFNITIISLLIVFYLSIIFSKKIDYKKVKSVTHIKNWIIITYNIVFGVLVLAESYIITGHIAPSLYGIDAHKLSIPIINIITRNLGLILILNIIYFDIKRKRKYLFLNIIYMSYFIIFRSARMVVFCAVIQMIIFTAIYYAKKINFKKIILGIILFVGIAIMGVIMGNYRMSDFGKYEVSYSDAIQYIGPKDSLGIISSYYGYFPMSFENLNLSIQKTKNNNATTYGLNTIAPILVGVFKLNNIVEDYPYLEYINENRMYNVGEATVPTGFLEFYLDFGDFIIIGLIIYLLITIYMYNKILKNIFYIFAYSALATAWAMMSFQNMLIIPNTMYQILIFGIIFKIFMRYDRK